MRRKLVLGLAAGAAMWAASATTQYAEAAPTCTVGGMPNDVTLTTGGVTYYSSPCGYLSTPNNANPATETAAFNDAFQGAGDAFVYLDKSEEAPGPAFQGILFTVNAPETTSGNWTVSWVDTNGANPLNLPITMDLGVILKAGSGVAGTDNDGTAGYVLQDVILAAPPGNDGTGTFIVNFVNEGGQTPDLSHLTLVGRLVDDNGGGFPIPEPATIALFGAGLLGLGLARRRRKA